MTSGRETEIGRIVFETGYIAVRVTTESRVRLFVERKGETASLAIPPDTARKLADLLGNASGAAELTAMFGQDAEARQ